MTSGPENARSDSREGKDSQAVVTALIKNERKLPQELYKSLTWDRGTEMHGRKRFTMATGIHVYFYDPKGPWQRGATRTRMGYCDSTCRRESTSRLIRSSSSTLLPDN